jgi:hypothetical protein
MFTTAVKGISALRKVGGTPGSLDKVSRIRSNILERAGGVQPIELPIVCEFKDELINHTIDANRATDKFEISVC